MADTTELVIQRKLASLNSFAIQAPDGGAAFDVKFHLGLGKESWTFTDSSGAEVGSLVRPPMHVHPTFELDRPGEPHVTISKANFMPVHETWRIAGTEHGDLDVNGDVADHEFTVTDASGAAVAQASRAWVTVHQTYAVRCNGLDPVVAAATAIAIDVTEHPRNV